MPQFTVKIREKTLEASSAREAALRCAGVIAFAHTVHIYEVTDETGKTEVIELTTQEIDHLAASAEEIRESLK